MVADRLDGVLQFSLTNRADCWNFDFLHFTAVRLLFAVVVDIIAQPLLFELLLPLPVSIQLPPRLVVATVMDVEARIAEHALTRIVEIFAQRWVVVDLDAHADIRGSPQRTLRSCDFIRAKLVFALRKKVEHVHFSLVKFGVLYVNYFVIVDFFHHLGLEVPVMLRVCFVLSIDSVVFVLVYRVCCSVVERLNLLCCLLF